MKFIKVLQADIWTTKDGRILKPHEMSERHIKNAMRMIKRNVHWYHMCKINDYVDATLAIALSARASIAIAEEFEELADMSYGQVFTTYIKTSRLWKLFRKNLRKKRLKRLKQKGK